MGPEQPGCISTNQIYEEFFLFRNPTIPDYNFPIVYDLF